MRSWGYLAIVFLTACVSDTPSGLDGGLDVNNDTGVAADTGVMDTGVDAGCPGPATQNGSSKCGNQTCMGDVACCLRDGGSSCEKAPCDGDAGAVIFQWGCDKQSDCTFSTCCIQLVTVSTQPDCPISATTPSTKSACVLVNSCGNKDLRPCGSNSECKSPETCKAVLVTTGGGKIVGACL